MVSLTPELLRSIVESILKALELDQASELSPPAPGELYVVCAEPWEPRHSLMLEQLAGIKGTHIRAVVPAEACWPTRLTAFAGWSSILTREQLDPFRLEGEWSAVFPSVPRDLLVKGALGICDTYETRWVRAAMEQGGKLFLPRRGFEHLSGKEPPRYRQMILSYCRILLEMGIALPEDLEGLEPCPEHIHAQSPPSSN